MKLQYHQATFELIGQEPKFSEQASGLLDYLEQRNEFKFPASLREWYSIESIHNILWKYSDFTIELTALEGIIPRELNTPVPLPYKYENSRFLIVLTDLGSGCFWAMPLDSLDDPPVLFDCSDWKPDCPSFSAWCYERIRFWIDDPNEFRDMEFSNETEHTNQWRHQHTGWMLAGYDYVSDFVLEFLLQKFQLGPQTKPDEKLFYFHSPAGDKQLLLNKHRWLLWGQTEESLMELAKTIWHCGNVAENLHDIGDYYTKIPELLRKTMPHQKD